MISTIENPTLIQSMKVGDYKIVLGRAIDSRKGQIYFCGEEVYAKKPDHYYSFQTSCNKDEIVEAYGDLAKQIAMRPCHSFLSLLDSEYFQPFYTSENCIPISEYDSIVGKVLVLEDYMALSHDTGAHQILMCVEEPNEAGEGRFVSILEGYEITDPVDYYIGVIKDDMLPPWAKERVSWLREIYHVGGVTE